MSKSKLILNIPTTIEGWTNNLAFVQDMAESAFKDYLLRLWVVDWIAWLNGYRQPEVH